MVGQNKKIMGRQHQNTVRCLLGNLVNIYKGRLLGGGCPSLSIILTRNVQNCPHHQSEVSPIITENLESVRGESRNKW